VDSGEPPNSPPAACPALPHSFHGGTLLALHIACRRARLAALEAAVTYARETAPLGACVCRHGRRRCRSKTTMTRSVEACPGVLLVFCIFN
jgi:hypothetical protein